MDSTDLRIITELQRDAGRSISETAAEVNLSSNACWRRIKALERDGVLRRRVALFDPEKLGVGVTVFVAVRTRDPSDAWLAHFMETIGDLEQVVELHRMSGKVDYLLKVVVSSVEEYDRLYRRMIRLEGILDVTANFCMEQIKHTTELPLTAALGD